MSAMYDYNNVNVEEQKEMLRAIGIFNFVKLKPNNNKKGFARVLEKWDKENFLKVAAYEERPPKQDTGGRAKGKSSEQPKSKPAPPVATASDAPRQKRKRKEPSPAPMSALATSGKRQKAVEKDVPSGDGERARLESEDARIDNDEDEEMADAPDKQLPARPKKKPTIRKPASPVVPRDGEGYGARTPGSFPRPQSSKTPVGRRNRISRESR
jgi:hypothetical protein